MDSEKKGVAEVTPQEYEILKSLLWAFDASKRIAIAAIEGSGLSALDVKQFCREERFLEETLRNGCPVCHLEQVDPEKPRAQSDSCDHD